MVRVLGAICRGKISWSLVLDRTIIFSSYFPLIGSFFLSFPILFRSYFILAHVQSLNA